MHLIEGWGTGIPRLLQDMKDYGLAEPEFIDMEVALRINLYRANTGRETIEKIKTSEEMCKESSEEIKTGGETSKENGKMTEKPKLEKKLPLRELSKKSRMIRLSHKNSWQIDLDCLMPESGML